MKKILITIVGGFLVMLGLIFVIVPGPAVILLVPGLFLLSFEYPAARKWLKICQRLMSKMARWIDSHLLRRKYGR